MVTETSNRSQGQEPLTGPARRGLALVSFAMSLFVALAALGVDLQPSDSTVARAATPARYDKVVALTPFAANALAQMGAFPEAIGQSLGGDRRYVSGLRSVPRIPMSHPNGPNMELLVTYDPDLVFTSPQWSAGRPAMETIAGRVVDADPNSIEGTYRKVRQMARLVGRKARGNRLIRQMRRSVRQSTKNIKARKDVMLILGVGKTPWVFLEDSWGGEIVRQAGGRLKTAGESGSGFSRISNEIVIEEDPEIIIAVPHADASEITSDVKRELRRQWAGTRAAENGQIFFSLDNSLLQAGTDIGPTITKVRSLLGTD